MAVRGLRPLGRPITAEHTVGLTGQSVSVKKLPSSLPAANSRKWHSRRLWDSLGYFRVRTLANPRWERDVDSVVGRLQREASAVPGPKRSHIDAAIAAAQAYARLKPRPSESSDAFETRREATWDAMLASIDAFLEIRQHEHLQAGQ